MSDVTDTAGQRDRSPAFPSISLEVALRRLSEFETHFRRLPARLEKIGDAWGMKGKGSVDRITAALRYFGLIEYQGVGTARHVIVSDEGRKYLRAYQDSIKQEVIKVAALRPKQIALFWDMWGKDRPADAACLDELIQKRGFSDSGARDFLRAYDATIAFAGLSDSDKDREPSEEFREVSAEDEPMQPNYEPAPTRNPIAPATQQAHPLPIGRPRIVMNGDRLDIQASVDLAGLKQLQAMLQKYEEILEMLS
jgi:hypothetical protein